MPESPDSVPPKADLRAVLFGIAAVLSLIASFLFKYGWIAFAIVVIAIMVLAHLPARHAFVECPRCGGVFQISIAEYYGCRGGGTWLVDCRHCGAEVEARQAKGKGPE